MVSSATPLPNRRSPGRPGRALRTGPAQRLDVDGVGRSAPVGARPG
ncbi:hypothetical protein [Streptomyces sp. NPDC059142]